MATAARMSQSIVAKILQRQAGSVAALAAQQGRGHQGTVHPVALGVNKPARSTWLHQSPTKAYKRTPLVV